MCFSAEVSFIASGIISVAGIIAIKKSKTNPQKVFASIPFIFGVQQFIEGCLWIFIDLTDYNLILSMLTYGFLFFAWIIWPIIIPLSLWLLEMNSSRKKMLSLCLLFGFLTTGILAFVLINIPIGANIAKNHIQYNIEFTGQTPFIITIAYLISTVFSLFISTRSNTWILGLVILSSYIFSKLYFTEHLISVWCFFSAISSLIIVWIIHKINDISVSTDQNANS